MQIREREREREREISGTLKTSRRLKREGKRMRQVKKWPQFKCTKSMPNNPSDQLSKLRPTRRQVNARLLFSLLLFSVGLLSSSLLESAAANQAASTSQRHDPRPTIYSGQISFALLLSAHSSPGQELSSSASQQVQSIFTAIRRLNGTAVEPAVTPEAAMTSANDTTETQLLQPIQSSETIEFDESTQRQVRRQIFTQSNRQPQQNDSQQGSTVASQCSQANPNALYAGMGAIWASHQANLVGDSQFTMGAYVYDSCNDLDIGQRQSVRIVANLNAFQQTTCESPRGSPISLAISHGDQQLRAIQLLTSFRVPVISTKEHFALEEFHQLTRDQRRFLFATAPSSRHLAMGAIRFGRRIVAKSASSPKLLNQFYKMSPRNGLVVISRNLPSRFILHLSEMIPNEVNYEILQSSQPIDQIRSVQSLENVFIKSKQSNAQSSSSTSESQQINSRLRASDRSDESVSGIDFDSAGDQDNFKMLSPTVLLFITPAEAIDLITRLRNDLADVSRYYSLIVVTREDITPALRTIFHRGGSRLCSGKAFYTISPRSEDISEFSRYFRDTVQIEAETSDHPLICEYARHQAGSRMSNELDEVGAEPVIKAVWTAAAAFKQVYKRECGFTSGEQFFRATTNSSSKDEISNLKESTRSLKGRQSGSAKSAHSECMIKMSKNMSQLVQRSLKRLDVTINSTGLQSMDGFRIKFDEMNELISNKFSIRHVNKECEIEEIGEFSGLKDSTLRLDENTLIKSLESTMPDPWPVSVTTTSSDSGRGSSTSVASLGLQDPSSSTTASSSSKEANTDEGSSSPENPTSKRATPTSNEDSSTADDETGPDTTTDADERGSGRHLRASQFSQVVSSSPPTTLMRRLKPFPTTVGTQLRDWLPGGYSTTPQPRPEITSIPTTTMLSQTSRSHDSTTTQTPIHSTLPESGGNTDLDMPARATIRTSKPTSKVLDFAASSDSTDFVTASTTSQFEQDTNRPRFNLLKDFDFTPVPLAPGQTRSAPSGQIGTQAQSSAHPSDNQSELRIERTRLRSHLRWIYNSWFALVILVANICGAILTLYVLTFLLMKNCDGTLDRENQGIRSMHLLAIIVVLFGSTLFIVAPTPGLCLLRTSWHNFSLVMLFGSLLSQSMQTRSLTTLGLGGRPNRLNQFLTLVFLVGVQVSFELQRWKYETANYINFVNQYFGSPESDYKKLMVLSNAIASQFNPLDSLSDMVTPVSIQVSEKYQKLLQDYCIQKTDEFLQGQIYLGAIVLLLILFSASSRNLNHIAGISSNQHNLTLTSGKLVASEHEANLNLSPSQFHFAPGSSSMIRDGGNILMVSLVAASIYGTSILFHIYGHNTSNRDLILSVTLVLIAFVALIGIFLPILNQIDRYDSLSSARPMMSKSKSNSSGGLEGQGGNSSAFTMFPEFTPAGHLRPSSTSGDSSSGGGSRRPFADTKESQRNMKLTLAHLAPSPDSLRGMGFYDPDVRAAMRSQQLDPTVTTDRNTEGSLNLPDVFEHRVSSSQNKQRNSKSSERRLIMLDVDPCCPKHGIAAWPKSNHEEQTQTRVAHV